MEKVSIKTAEKEVKAWADYKKIDETKREENKEQLAKLAEAISLGHLSYDSKEHFLVQKLKFPLGEGATAVTELKYKARLKMNEVTARTKNVKPSDTYGLITAYVCALTDQNSGILGGLDSEDNRIAQAIAVFFL